MFTLELLRLVPRAPSRAAGNAIGVIACHAENIDSCELVRVDAGLFIFCEEVDVGEVAVREGSSEFYEAILDVIVERFTLGDGIGVCCC